MADKIYENSKMKIQNSNAPLLEIYLHLTQNSDLMQLFCNILIRYIRFNFEIVVLVLPYALNPVWAG